LALWEDSGVEAAPQDPRWLHPAPASPGSSPELPETTGYKLKRILLGKPLVSQAMEHQRLSKPIALAVLSSDVMSSAAYGTESVLRVLIPVAGLGAFALITPITVLLLVVLGLVCALYRRVVKAYPVAGGSYVVSRENFGYTTAQIPGAALLCSYTLTVAVSVAAGVDAVISAVPALAPYPVELSVGAVAVLAYGNLRGIREAGKIFAVPTYWFIASMTAVIVAGVLKVASGGLNHVPMRGGHVHVAPTGPGLLLGASVFIFLRGFANGGSAMTGMEAISNAVTVFREPQVRNARTTLVTMASIIGALFLAVSVFSALTHAIPYLSGTPTVLSQIGRQVFGTGAAGAVPFYSLQFSTALILVLGANTSFNGFPLLVSFIAQDAYLPRPLVTRGHRLVYSNGILALAVLSVALLVATRARVANLIPLYATTVFTGFTMAGAGMTRYFLRHRDDHPVLNLAVCSTAFVASGIVTLIFAVTEFTSGAWLVVVAIPLIVLVLARTHRRYESERAALAEGEAASATEAPPLRNHVVVVMVDRLDLATARAIRLARSLGMASEVRVVHFVIDDERAARLTRGWSRLGFARIELELVDCPDRRLARAAAEMADDLASDGETEVLFVLPRRASRGVTGRLLHDRTADRIVAAVTQIENVSATIAPFDTTGALRRRRQMGSQEGAHAAAVEPARSNTGRPPASVAPVPSDDALGVEGTIPIGQVSHRRRARVAGRVRTVSVQTWAGGPAFECTVVDATGALTVVFMGRRSIPGIKPGAHLLVEGMVGNHRGRLAMLNPTYDLLVIPAAQPGRRHEGAS
jgi:amino acid transporter